VKKMDRKRRVGMKVLTMIRSPFYTYVYFFVFHGSSEQIQDRTRRLWVKISCTRNVVWREVDVAIYDNDELFLYTNVWKSGEIYIFVLLHHPNICHMIFVKRYVGIWKTRTKFFVVAFYAGQLTLM